MIQIETRPVVNADDPARDFILHSWIASILWSLGVQYEPSILKKHHKDWPPALLDYLHSFVSSIERSTPTLATIPGERDCYVGWICGAPNEIRYVYVKWAYKRQGIAIQLIEKVCGLDGGYYYAPTRIVGFRKWLANNGWKYIRTESDSKTGTEIRASR